MNVTFRNAGFEYSIESILLFQTEDTNPYWSDSLRYFYPEINQNIQAWKESEKEDYLRTSLRKIWDRVLPEIEAKNAGIMSIFRNIEIKSRMHFRMPLNWIAEQCSTSCLPILR